MNRKIVTVALLIAARAEAKIPVMGYHFDISRSKVLRMETFRRIVDVLTL